MYYIGKREANYLGLNEEDRQIHNEQFLEKALVRYQSYFDHLFDDIDKNICLDEEQRKAILIDEDYEMVIAGAGSGKTTTMVGKVKYLVDFLKIDPTKILVISYTNKAVDELKRQLCDQLLLPVNIGTFHGVAFKWLKEITNKNYDVESNGMAIIDQFIRNKVFNNPTLRKQFNQIFSDYFYLSTKCMRHLCGMKEYFYSGKKGNLIMESKMDEWFSFESEYQCILNFRPIFPDTNRRYFCSIIVEDIPIYIDYFEPYNSFVSKLRFYQNTYRKKMMHRKTHSHYLIVFKGENIEKTILSYCQKQHIRLIKRDSKWKFSYFIKQKQSYHKVLEIIYQFILLWKRTGKTKFSKNFKSEKEKMFSSFINEVILYYQSELQKRNTLDFEDIIVYAYQKFHKKMSCLPEYIIVDEYQDISKNRFLFLKKLCKVSRAKLIVVGDDWQSIYNFSGSDLDLFISFQSFFKYSKIVQITNTYRNSQELIDISGRFIMKNSQQIQKKLHSSKHLSSPIYLSKYRNNKEKRQKLKEILKSIYQNNPQDRVLLLSRFHFDFNFLECDSEFCYKNETLIYRLYPDLSITCLTIHASKGLGFDQVILVNNSKGVYGFPSLKPVDPYLNLICSSTEEELLMEERRLFYVALTRTKNHVYLLVPHAEVSSFVDEIKKEKNVISL